MKGARGRSVFTFYGFWKWKQEVKRGGSGFDFIDLACLGFSLSF